MQSRSDGKGQRLNVDLMDDGSVRVRIEGTGIPGQVDEEEACRILLARLDPGGLRWAPPKRKTKADGLEDGVDVVAAGLKGGQPLEFQVTRIDPDKPLWEARSVKGKAEKTYPSVAAVSS